MADEENAALPPVTILVWITEKYREYIKKELKPSSTGVISKLTWPTDPVGDTQLKEEKIKTSTASTSSPTHSNDQKHFDRSHSRDNHCNERFFQATAMKKETKKQEEINKKSKRISRGENKTMHVKEEGTLPQSKNKGCSPTNETINRPTVSTVNLPNPDRENSVNLNDTNLKEELSGPPVNKKRRREDNEPERKKKRDKYEVKNNEKTDIKKEHHENKYNGKENYEKNNAKKATKKEHHKKNHEKKDNKIENNKPKKGEVTKIYSNAGLNTATTTNNKTTKKQQDDCNNNMTNVKKTTFKQDVTYFEGASTSSLGDSLVHSELPPTSSNPMHQTHTQQSKPQKTQSSKTVTGDKRSENRKSENALPFKNAVKKIQPQIIQNNSVGKSQKANNVVRNNTMPSAKSKPPSIQTPNSIKRKLDPPEEDHQKKDPKKAKSSACSEQHEPLSDAEVIQKNAAPAHEVRYSNVGNRLLKPLNKKNTINSSQIQRHPEPIESLPDTLNTTADITSRSPPNTGKLANPTQPIKQSEKRKGYDKMRAPSFDETTFCHQPLKSLRRVSDEIHYSNIPRASHQSAQRSSKSCVATNINKPHNFSPNKSSSSSSNTSVNVSDVSSTSGITNTTHQTSQSSNISLETSSRISASAEHTRPAPSMPQFIEAETTSTLNNELVGKIFLKPMSELIKPRTSELTNPPLQAFGVGNCWSGSDSYTEPALETINFNFLYQPPNYSQNFQSNTFSY